MNSGPITRIIAEAELLVILAIGPALLFPTPSRLLVLMVVPVLAYSAWVTYGTVIPRTPLNVSLGSLLIMVMISTTTTFDILFSLDKISGVILGVLVFWAVVRWTTSPAKLATITAVFLLAGAVLSVLGLLGTHHGQYEHPDSWASHWRVVIPPIRGAENGFNPNAVAGCLVLFLPLQIALFFFSPRWWERWSQVEARGNWGSRVQGALLVVSSVTLVAMQSRGALLGVGLVSAVALLAFSRGARILAALALGVIILGSVMLGPRAIARDVFDWAGPAMEQTVTIRLSIWSRAIVGIQDFPWAGMGMNVARTVLPVTPPRIETAHAHNHLLQAALDLGIPGLIAYMSIWAVVAVLLARVWLRSRQIEYRVAAAGLAAGLTAHFIFGMTDAIPLGSKVGVLFWLTLALTVSLYQIAIGGKKRLR